MVAIAPAASLAVKTTRSSSSSSSSSSSASSSSSLSPSGGAPVGLPPAGGTAAAPDGSFFASSGSSAGAGFCSSGEGGLGAMKPTDAARPARPQIESGSGERYPFGFLCDRVQFGKHLG